MPIADDELERALRAAAPAIDTAGVVERVTTKRARRRTTRTVGLSVLAITVAFVVVGSVLLVSRDRDARITTPAVPGPSVEPLKLEGAPHEWYLRGPLTMSEGMVSVAAYDRNRFDFPPSHIVRFDPDTLRVRDAVELQAEILSVADGADGVRWAVTRNKDPEGPVPAGHFLKRIDPDGTVRSTDLPAGTEVVCCVTVQGDRVVVPTSRDVLAFDLQRLPASTDGLFPGNERLTLIDGMVVERSQRVGNRSWFTGQLHGQPTVVLQKRNRIVDTITLPGADNGSFVWADDDTVLATTGGRLVRIDVERD